MKKNILLIALCMFSIVVFAQKKQLTILHTNDTHSQIMPFNTTLADTLRAGRAGFERRIAMLKERKTLTCCCSIAETSAKVHPTSLCSKVM